MKAYFVNIDVKKQNDFRNPDKYIHVSIDGEKVGKKAVAFKAFEDQLQFPTSCGNKYARFEDWMKDLSWFPSEKGLCIMIDHYSSFLKDEPEEKETIMDILCNEVVFFWKTEVEQVVKGGKPREVVVLISD